MDRAYSENGGRQESFQNLRCKSRRKISLGSPRRRLEDNVRMDLKNICVSGRNCVDSAQDRDCWRGLVNVALNLRVQ